MSGRERTIKHVQQTAGFLALFVCAASNGQSVNVDFHDVDGTPTSDYGAAGLPGFWNSFTTTAGVDTPLLGLDGAPTGVTLRHNGAGYQRESSQTTVGNDSALLRDYLFSVGPAITLEFAGLANGTYEAYTYAYFHENYPFSTDVWINGDLDTLQVVTGTFANGFDLGMSHARHTFKVTDGALSIWLDNVADPLVNGVQLAIIPAPPTLPLVLLVGFSTMRRRRR